ncbi:putative ribonuclease H-like domain-containing protein [Tanacetum coccineum]
MRVFSYKEVTRRCLEALELKYGDGGACKMLGDIRVRSWRFLSLDRKSTTGGCQFLGKRLISWQCKKQTIVANSTTMAEYVAAAN